MDELIARAIRSRAPLSPAAEAALVAVCERRSFSAGEWLLRGGDHARSCFLVVEGLARELYIDPDGREHTRSFMWEGHVTGSLLDLLSRAPSITWIEALEPTACVVWSWADQEALAARFPEFQILLRRTAEALYVRKARREYEMLALTAEERYAAWRRDFAAVDARVQRRHVASYLGISPEHLSRIGRR